MSLITALKTITRTNSMNTTVTESTESNSIDIDIDDKVLIHDGSFINDIPCMPIIETHGIYKRTGIVARLNSCQVAEYKLSDKVKLELEMPIVVITDDNEVIYCNPVNIIKID